MADEAAVQHRQLYLALSGQAVSAAPAAARPRQQTLPKPRAA